MTLKDVPTEVLQNRVRELVSGEGFSQTSGFEVFQGEDNVYVTREQAIEELKIREGD